MTAALPAAAAKGEGSGAATPARVADERAENTGLTALRGTAIFVVLYHFMAVLLGWEYPEHTQLFIRAHLLVAVPVAMHFSVPDPVTLMLIACLVAGASRCRGWMARAMASAVPNWLAVSAVTYKLIEAPGRLWLRRAFARIGV